MGYTNDDLILSYTRMRSEDPDKRELLEKIRETQETCPHLETKESRFHKDSPNGTYRAPGSLTMCCACSKVLVCRSFSVN